MKLVAVGLVVAAVLSGCSEDDPVAEPTPSPSASASVDSPVPSESPADDRDLDVDELVVPAASAAFPAAWTERFVVPYGADVEQLGTAPGGDSGTLDIGPESGAPAPDGTWWFLDAAKQRLAHYDADGAYLDAVAIPESLLVGGVYFQWQLPHVLDDGTLYAARQGEGSTYLLRLRDGVVDEVAVGGSFVPTYDDGADLFGFNGRGRLVRVDVTDGAMSRVTALPTRSGSAFSIRLGDTMRVTRAAVTNELPIVTASGAPAHVGLQLRAGADDVLHLFLTGIGEDDDSVQLVGATLVAADGAVAEVEALPNPLNETDPGSPAQLAMVPGSSTPMLVYVLPDGLHVYQRTG